MYLRFPVDEQYCQVKFESFGFTNKQVWPSTIQNAILQTIFALTLSSIFADSLGMDGPFTVTRQHQHISGSV